jgi:His/Glu/Gln/Arg/opine family amino acid ABC transporter permease subunit
MSHFLAIYAANWSDWWPQLAAGAFYSLLLTAAAFSLALLLGLMLALARRSAYPILRRLSIAYTELMRGIPPLAVLFLLYFGLPPIGILLSEFAAGFVGLGLVAAGYVAEIFRAGLQAVHPGQREAALAIGMTPSAAMRHILFPQAMRVVLPPLLNMLIVVLKDSSVCALISAPELMLRTKEIATDTFLPMHLYLLAGIIYFCMATPMSMLVRRLENRFARGRQTLFRKAELTP